ncbi:MAG: PEGA domain-containing protein [Spirochaetaceae bacterium]|jgi:hypothetical protein|nr:PEGA domain-containing protein [Spirochaetaceae bacterium]
MRTSFAVFLFFIFSTGIMFPLGKSENKKQDILNTKWALCITQFDVSGLPPAQAAIGNVVMRKLVKHFASLEFKLRKTAEYDYYWKAAWLRSQSEMAKKIVDKQAQRDHLLYQNALNWNTKRKRNKIDKEIKELRAVFEETEIHSPSIWEKPVFSVADDNLMNNFPAAPAAGGEYYLCSDKKADGLLLGRVSIYHERILVELRLWTVWTRSVSYKDKILFSIEDIDLALDEFSAELINSISGMIPASIAVSAKPENAVIIIDDYHAGRGKSEVMERTPGPVEVTVYAENYVTSTEEINLTEGEYVEAEFDLKPIPVETVIVETTSGETANVYSGSLFAGVTPITLSGPLNKYKQISVETGAGKTAQSLFKIETQDSTLKLNPVIPPEIGRTEKARKGFYGALGRLWLIGPLAFLTAGISNSYTFSYNLAQSNRTPDKLNAQRMWFYTAGGLGVLTGIVVVEFFVRLGIYLYQGSKESALFRQNQNNAIFKQPENDGTEPFDMSEEAGGRINELDNE